MFSSQKTPDKIFICVLTVMMYTPNTWPNFNTSVVAQNVCPGGSIYFRIVPTVATGPCNLEAYILLKIGIIKLSVTFPDGKIELTLVVGKNVPEPLTIKFTSSPFSVVTNKGTYTPTLSSIPSQNTPFDFLISCEAQTFKLFVDGQMVASTLSNFHTVQNGKLTVPNVVNIAFTSQSANLNKFSYTYCKSFYTVIFYLTQMLLF